MTEFVFTYFWFRANYLSFEHLIDIKVGGMRQGMFTLSGAPSTTSHFGYYTYVHFRLLHFG